jgi:hypothetical protein
MDREKVIKELEEISDYFFDIYRNEKNGYSPAQEYCNAAEDAIALLKELQSQIEILEYKLAVAENNLNYYINGND